MDRQRFGWLVVGGVLLAGCGRAKARKDLETKLAAVESAAAERASGFETALAQRGSVRPGSRDCPLSPRASRPVPGSKAAVLDDQLAHMVTAAGQGHGNAVVARAGARVSPPHLEISKKRIDGIRTRLAANEDPEKLRQEVDELTGESFWTWDLVVVIEDESTPGVIDSTKKTFEAGATRGRSYAYDYRKKKIVCAGEFEATNAARLTFAAKPGETAVAAGGAIENDLDARTSKAGRDALRSSE